MKNIILIGGGGHCRSCIDVIESTEEFNIIGILDVQDNLGKMILNYPIIGTDDEILRLKATTDYFFITIGQLKTYEKREALFHLLKKTNCLIPNIISPLAYVSKHAKVGVGTIIHHGAIVNANASIGENCIINTKSLIEHDVIVGNHCHISTGSIVNGGTIIENGVFFGSGAVCKQGTVIKQNSFIKANSTQK